MQCTFNLGTYSLDTDKFTSASHLRDFYTQKGLDGLEIAFITHDTTIPEKMEGCNIIGVHLACIPAWMDFWKGNKEALLETYGSEEEIIKIFGGTTREDYLNIFRKELECASAIGAKYVVFHVCEVTLLETTTYTSRFSDEEVIDATLEVINALLHDKDYNFYFLCENLWWAGLNFKRPEITKRLMNGINYEHKGIILDIGHVMHTNTNLRSQEEALKYVEEIYDNDAYLQKYLRAMHVHQTLNGAYVKEYLANPPRLSEDYNERQMEMYMHVWKIDNHRPINCEKLAALVAKMNPEFLTHELITSDFEELDTNLDIQLKSVNGHAN